MRRKSRIIAGVGIMSIRYIGEAQIIIRQYPIGPIACQMTGAMCNS